jgi:hypothetical protein
MRRIVAPAVLVAACLALPAGVLAAKPPKQPAKLTLTAAPVRVTFGKPTVLAGKLTGGKTAAAQTVVVQADVFPLDGQYADVATTTTDANGDWHVSQTPTALTRYRAEAKTSPPTTSNTADVAVRLRVRVHVSDRTPARGSRVRFSGTATPAHDGARVRIQRRTATGHWRTVARTTLRDAGDASSRYSKRVRVRRSGTYRVRASSGDTDHLAGTSRRRRLTVH